MPSLTEARSHLKPADRDSHTKYYSYLPRESRRTTAPSIQRRTFDAGRAEQASNARTR